MLIVLASSLRLNFSTFHQTRGQSTDYSQPGFTKYSAWLVDRLKKYSPLELAGIIEVSDVHAVRNAGYYEEWASKATQDNAKQALFAFDGDAYRKLQGITMNADQLAYLDDHLRIFSGLYGILNPFDAIQPYRLEMGVKLTDLGGQYLYEYWRDKVTDALNQEAEKKQIKALINLASKEYFRVVDTKKLRTEIITPVFQEWRNNKGITTPTNAKRARGAMVRFAALNNITDPESLKLFDEDGYVFDDVISTGTTWFFRR